VRAAIISTGSERDDTIVRQDVVRQAIPDFSLQIAD
jgi:hypothetical protein